MKQALSGSRMFLPGTGRDGWETITLLPLSLKLLCQEYNCISIITFLNKRASKEDQRSAGLFRLSKTP